MLTKALSSNGQDIIGELQKHAIPISDLHNLDSAIYDEIKDYEIIMVGEMHGTNEPTEFVFGLVKLLSKQGENVVLAMEIPKAEIGEIDLVDETTLRSSKYFSKENSDGRNGKAWFNLIIKSSLLANVNIEFIDNEYFLPRDSSMYIDLVKVRNKYSGSKIVTLTGNIHNWLKPFRESPTMGSYLVNDTLNFQRQNIMSINHIYKEGTMMNNIGNGLELRTVAGKDNFYNQTIEAKKYLCRTLLESQNQYTHFLYTEKVTHSDKLE